MNKKLFNPFFIFLILLLISCKQNITSPNQYNSLPNKITLLQAYSKDSAVALSWQTPKDDNLYGIEIQYYKTDINRVLTPLDTNAIVISKDINSYLISNLENDIQYTFSLRTINTNGNKSDMVVVNCTPKYLQKLPIQLNISKSTTQTTNQDIIITITCNNSRKVSTLKWAKGIQSLEYFNNNGINIENNCFTVETNGIYTVFAQDIDGKIGLESFNIDNIDKTKPNSIKNFSATYNLALNQIELSWNNPIDIDYSCVEIKFNNILKKISQDLNSFIISNIEPNGTLYEFEATSIDVVGNKGQPVKCSIIATSSPAITSIDLTKNHIAYNDNNKTIGVTIRGINFDLIKNQKDKKILVGLWDENNVLINSVIDTEIDDINNIATTTFIAPSLTYGETSVEGNKYTIKAIICGKESPIKIPFIISRETYILGDPIFDITELPHESSFGKTTKISFKGVNLDIANPLTIQLYDSFNNPIGESICINVEGNQEQTISAVLPIPNKMGLYTAKILINGEPEIYSYYKIGERWNMKCLEYPTIHNYGTPSISNIYIPNAGLSKKFGELIATVKGTNFLSPLFNKNNIKLTSSDNSIISNFEITVVNDNTLRIKLTIPSSENNYNVKISYNNSNAETTFNVKDYSKYNIGDVILNDGSNISYQSITQENISKAVAIVGGFNTYGVAFGIGLNESPELAWAREKSNGYYFEFSDITCTPKDNAYSIRLNTHFTGDIDGKDNWDRICSMDSNALISTKNDYPVFDWINNYGTFYKINGQFNDGWYLPSIVEHQAIYKNTSILREAFSAIGNRLFSETHSYWSSSQVYISPHDMDRYIYIYVSYFMGGSISKNRKDSLINAFAIIDL